MNNYPRTGNASSNTALGTSQQSQGQWKNLDHAFPPFLSGISLPSVYERAGFEVNRSNDYNSDAISIKSKSSSKSRRHRQNRNNDQSAMHHPLPKIQVDLTSNTIIQQENHYPPQTTIQNKQTIPLPPPSITNSKHDTPANPSGQNLVNLDNNSMPRSTPEYPSTTHSQLQSYPKTAQSLQISQPSQSSNDSLSNPTSHLTTSTNTPEYLMSLSNNKTETTYNSTTGTSSPPLSSSSSSSSPSYDNNHFEPNGLETRVNDINIISDKDNNNNNNNSNNSSHNLTLNSTIDNTSHNNKNINQFHNISLPLSNNETAVLNTSLPNQTDNYDSFKHSQHSQQNYLQQPSQTSSKLLVNNNNIKLSNESYTPMSPQSPQSLSFASSLAPPNQHPTSDPPSEENYFDTDQQFKPRSSFRFSNASSVYSSSADPVVQDMSPLYDRQKSLLPYQRSKLEQETNYEKADKDTIQSPNSDISLEQNLFQEVQEQVRLQEELQEQLEIELSSHDPDRLSNTYSQHQDEHHSIYSSSSSTFNFNDIPSTLPLRKRSLSPTIEESLNTTKNNENNYSNNNRINRSNTSDSNEYNSNSGSSSSITQKPQHQQQLQQQQQQQQFISQGINNNVPSSSTRRLKVNKSGSNMSFGGDSTSEYVSRSSSRTSSVFSSGMSQLSSQSTIDTGSASSLPSPINPSSRAIHPYSSNHQTNSNYNPSNGFIPPLSSTNTPLMNSKNPNNSKKGPCRGCGQNITGKSVYSRDGKLSGRWHRDCFACTGCQTRDFSHRPEGAITSNTNQTEFYILNDNPYCYSCYHSCNNSICKICNLGIEGRCLDDGYSRYHASCAVCTVCSISLTVSEESDPNDYENSTSNLLPPLVFVVNNKLYCSQHAKEIEASGGVDTKIEKRRTRLMMM